LFFGFDDLIINDVIIKPRLEGAISDK